MPDIEIENTFLLNSIPENLEGWVKEYTKDTYLPPQSDHPQIRLRKRGDDCYLTKKFPKKEGDQSVMIEETIGLTEVEYNFFENSLTGKVLEKIRYSKKFEDHTIEIDVYQANLTPLMVMDIEWVGSPKEIDLSEFDIKKEVTQSVHLAAGMLAGKKYSEISQYL